MFKIFCALALSLCAAPSDGVWNTRFDEQEDLETYMWSSWLTMKNIKEQWRKCEVEKKEPIQVAISVDDNKWDKFDIIGTNMCNYVGRDQYRLCFAIGKDKSVYYVVRNEYFATPSYYPVQTKKYLERERKDREDLEKAVKDMENELKDNAKIVEAWKEKPTFKIYDKDIKELTPSFPDGCNSILSMVTLKDGVKLSIENFAKLIRAYAEEKPSNTLKMKRTKSIIDNPKIDLMRNLVGQIWFQLV